MPSKADLHVHTSASDGVFSPPEVVKMAVDSGLLYLSITDHDTTDGIAQALETASLAKICLIPGVEISTDSQAGLAHVLGYFIDYKNEELVTTLKSMRHSRQLRARDMVQKLQRLGVDVRWERVQELAGAASIGRPHIAQAMLEKNYISTFAEAFTKYIGQGGPAYAERIKITPGEAVRLIKQANGLAVLAHPLTINNTDIFIKQLKKEGLDGIEVFYGEYGESEINKLSAIADRLELLKTGGSDFHGINASSETPIGHIEMPEENVLKLITAASNINLP